MQQIYKDLIGKVVVFNDFVEKYEINFDIGMKARIIDIEESECLDFLFDFFEFEEYNKTKGRANFYDKEGKSTLFWWETSIYPATSKRESVYLDYNTEKFPWPFDIVPEKKGLETEVRYIICSEFLENEKVEKVSSYAECNKDLAFDVCKARNEDPNYIGKYFVVKSETTFSIVS